MNLPPFFPGWMFLYFAGFGTLALILVSLIFWTWMRVTRLVNGSLRTALKWNMVGYCFLFCASWFACGVGAGPGNLLSTDPAMHNPFLASMAAVAGMFTSVAGWAFLLTGQRKLLRSLEKK
jgi:hypothetical protein